jgi:hypothetical protein
MIQIRFIGVAYRSIKEDEEAMERFIFLVTVAAIVEQRNNCTTAIYTPQKADRDTFPMDLQTC